MPAETRNNRPTPDQRIEIIRAETFTGCDWLVHGFSTRRGSEGALDLGLTSAETPEIAQRNRASFLRAMGAVSSGKTWPLVNLKQVHSDVVHCVDGVPNGQLVGDGLLTLTPRIVLAVQTADCLPVLVADPENKAVAVFHAGWRGTVARIVEKGVGEMRRQFRSDPAKLLAALGPGIHSCCYEVGNELRDRFEAQFAYGRELFSEVFESDAVRERYPLLFMTARAPGHSDLGPKLHLDLVEANRRQLRDAGLAAENIWTSELCTSCHTELLFSHRAEQGKTGRMMGAIGIRA